MENSFGIIQSRELEISSSPIQPENTLINSMSNSENDLSQPASESVPPITSDVDAYEMTKDGKRKLTSFVWNHFKRKTINGEEKVVCNYCNRALMGRRNDGSKHLNRHF